MQPKFFKMDTIQLTVHSLQEPVKGHWLPVPQVPLEKSVESLKKFSEIPLETSENLLETG